MKKSMFLACLVLSFAGCGQKIVIDPCLVYTVEGTLSLHPECKVPTPTPPPPSPVATPEPSPVPRPTPTPIVPPVTLPPSPVPVPTPTTPPSPSTSPSPESDPNRPADVKLGLKGTVEKTRGVRNTFDVSPIRADGSVIGPESNLGCYLVQKYGEFVRYQVANGVQSALELQEAPFGTNCDEKYILVDATNSDDNPEHWNGKTYLEAGPRSYCVSYRHLDHYTCLDCKMNSQGKVTDCQPGSRYRVPKTPEAVR